MKIYKLFIFLLLFQSNAIYSLENGVALNLRVFLSSCYENGEMRVELNSKSVIPLNQPYSISPWNYYGKERLDQISPNMVDWILVELRDRANHLASSRAGVLLKNGNVVDLDGTSSLKFDGLNDGDYFIVIKHRNHLGVITNSRYYLSKEPITVDFTISNTSLFNLNSQKNLGNNNFALFAGDANLSGDITILDYQPIANNIYRLGYITEDLDLNGVVNVLDYSVVYNNILKKTFIPELIVDESYSDTASNYEQLIVAINSANNGDKIALNGDIIVPHGTEISINKDLSLVGIVDPLPKITNNSTNLYYGLVQINNSRFEIHNIDVDGQNYSSQRDGLQFNNSVAVINNCILQNFSFSPVNVYNNSVVTVKDSRIIDNDKAGLGYGISVASGAKVIAHDNYFNNNRHHIAGGDRNLDKQPSFTLYNNVFDKSTNYTTYTGTAVDMHGQAHYTKNGNDIYAGKVLKVYNNMFNDPTGVGIGIRGVPVDSLIVYGNTFAHDWIFYLNQRNTIQPAIQQYMDPAVNSVSSETAYGNFYIGGNTYSGVKPPYHWDQWESTFQVNYAGTWNRLCAVSNEITVQELLFGDFNGDGVTDIISDRNVTEPVSISGYPEGIDETGKIWVSWGGLTMWKVLNNSNYSISLLSVADVDNDGKSDLIYNKTIFASGGVGEWNSLPNAYSSYTLFNLPDFNGDGNVDQFQISTE